MTLALATKGILSDDAVTLASKGILAPAIVIIEPVEPPRFPSVGGGGGGKPPTREPLRKIKVTVLMSGDTSSQEIIVDPSIGVKAQILEVFELPENTVFVRVKRK